MYIYINKILVGIEVLILKKNEQGETQVVLLCQYEGQLLLNNAGNTQDLLKF